MANTVVTTNGLNFMSSAHPAGPLFAIKYWVPVYDWRLDPDIRHTGRGYSATNLAIAEAQGRTYPAGEILWNEGVDGYLLSDETAYQYILSGYGSSVNTNVITNSKQTSGPVPINLVGGTTPVGNFYRGSKGNFSTSTPGTWNGSSVTLDPGTNTSYQSAPSYYYPVIDFLPVVETGQTKVKAQFTCRLSIDVGSIKYNKIALYAIRYTGAGVVDSTPHFVGEAYLLSGYPIKKSRFGEGYNETTINVQLEFNMTSAWADVFYGSSADYWSKVQNGLHSSEKISVGTFQNANNEPMATAHFGRTIDENADYEDRPNLRLEYVDDTITNGYTWDFTVNNSGDLLLSAGHSDAIIKPLSPIPLGSLANPFGPLVVSSTNFANEDLNQLFRSSDGSFEIYKGKVAFYDSYDNDAYDRIQYNKFVGGDLQRNYTDLIVQDVYRSIYVVAGLNQNDHYNTLYSSYMIKGHYLYSKMNDNTANYYDTSANTGGASTLNIIAKNGTYNSGPLELDYTPSKNYYDAVLGQGADYIGDSGVVFSRNNKILLIAGANYNSFSDWQVNRSSKYFLDALLCRMSYVDFGTSNLAFNPYSEGYLSTHSEYHLMAYSNIFYGYLFPTCDNIYPIGTLNRRMSSVISKNFDLAYNNIDGNSSYFRGNYSTIVGDPTLLNSKNLMTFTVKPTIDPAIQVPYFSIGEEYPIDRLDVMVLNLVAGTNAVGAIAGIYAQNVDMLVRTITPSYVNVLTKIESDNGYYEKEKDSFISLALGYWKTFNDASIKPRLHVSFLEMELNIYQLKYTIIGKTLIIKYILECTFKMRNAAGFYGDCWLDLTNTDMLPTIIPYPTLHRYQIVPSTYNAYLAHDKNMFLQIHLNDVGVLFWNVFGEPAVDNSIVNKSVRFDVQSIYEII